MRHLSGKIRGKFINQVVVIDGSNGIIGFPDRPVGTSRTLPVWPSLFDRLIQAGAIMDTLEVSRPLPVDRIPLGFHDSPPRRIFPFNRQLPEKTEGVPKRPRRPNRRNKPVKSWPKPMDTGPEPHISPKIADHAAGRPAWRPLWRFRVLAVGNKARLVQKIYRQKCAGFLRGEVLLCPKALFHDLGNLATMFTGGFKGRTFYHDPAYGLSS